MKPLYKVLHDKAMEFVDEARLDKMEGNQAAATTFFEKAYGLEKEAALSAPTTEDAEFARHLYLRSAAYLAYDTGHLWNALQLTQMGLAGNPPSFINKQLQDLKKELGSKNVSLQVVGVFTQADAKESAITVEDEDSRQVYFIVVPTEKIQEIVRLFWSAKVAIKARLTNKGLMMLENITAAA